MAESRCATILSLDSGLGYNRVARKALHIAGGVFALLMPVLPYWALVLFAATGLGLAYVMRPDHGWLRTITKPVDRRLGIITGVRGYFTTAVALVIVWPLFVWLHVPGAARYIAFGWLALAWGDGLAGIAGPRATPLTRVPWNPDKTWWGVGACFIGTLAGFVVAYTLRLPDVANPVTGIWLLVLGIPISAVVALAESLHLPIDDNYVVGIGAPIVALVVIGLSQISR